MTPFLPAGTDHHFVNALRFCPTTSSTSGMSASGQGPVAPSGPEAMVTLCMTSANTRTLAAGIVAPFGPVSGWDHEYEVSISASFAVVAWRTTIWNPSYSFRAAERAADVAAGSASDGGTLVVPSVTRTVAARDATGAARKMNAQAANHLVARMHRLPTGALARILEDRHAARLRCERATVHAFGYQVNRGKVGSCRQGSARRSVTLPPTLAGMLLGQWLRPRTTEQTFRRVFFAGLLMLGAYIPLQSCY